MSWLVHDNGGEYSDHTITFVRYDPAAFSRELVEAAVERFLRGKIIAFAEAVEWRDAEPAKMGDLFDPEIFCVEHGRYAWPTRECFAERSATVKAAREKMPADTRAVLGEVPENYYKVPADFVEYREEVHPEADEKLLRALLPEWRAMSKTPPYGRWLPAYEAIRAKLGERP